MNDKFSPTLFILILFLLLLSCQKASINGNLDGRWQVMEVCPSPQDTIIDTRLYYGFYLHVCNLTYYGGSFTEGNMKYEGSSLYMDFPNDTTIDSFLRLKQYGINSNPVIFNVEYIDKNYLILKDGDTTVTLRKF